MTYSDLFCNIFSTRTIHIFRLLQQEQQVRRVSSATEKNRQRVEKQERAMQALEQQKFGTPRSSRGLEE